jgi:hypothetical protein
MTAISALVEPTAPDCPSGALRQRWNHVEIYKAWMTFRAAAAREPDGRPMALIPRRLGKDEREALLLLAGSPARRRGAPNQS